MPGSAVLTGLRACQNGNRTLRVSSPKSGKDAAVKAMTRWPTQSAFIGSPIYHIITLFFHLFKRWFLRF